MSVDTLEKPQSVEQAAPPEKKKSWFNWEDPAVPVGNSPPIPKWPLAVITAAWLVWVLVLFVMMLGSRSSV